MTDRPSRSALRFVAPIAALLLGGLFVWAGLTYLLGAPPDPSQLPEGSPMASFMLALGPTGYMTFVKVLEVAGGALVAIPWTRRVGLLVVGPIIVNILAFHVFVTGGHGLLEPVLLAVCALAVVLVWCERAAFIRFVR